MLDPQIDEGQPVRIGPGAHLRRRIFQQAERHEGFLEPEFGAVEAPANVAWKRLGMTGNRFLEGVAKDIEQEELSFPDAWRSRASGAAAGAAAPSAP